MRDPYAVLGVRRDASTDEIKAAWRAAAKRVHPDQNPDDPAAAHRFSEIGRAYDVLKDPDRRRRFDRARAEADARKRDETYMERRRKEEARDRAEAEAARSRTAPGPESEGEPQPGDGPPGSDDWFSRIFGGKTGEDAHGPGAGERFQDGSGANGRHARRPDDHVHPFSAGEHEAAVPGSARDLFAQLLRRFAFLSTPPEKAPDLPLTLTLPVARFLEGGEVEARLPDGRIVPFDLPPGATAGTTHRLDGQGHRLPGMKRGDLVVTFAQRPDPFFRLDGHSIITHHPVDIENAVLGCRTMVETPDGHVEIEVPEWSGSDHVVVVEGQGLKRPDGSRGDLVVELRVMLWDLPDPKVIDLMRSLREGLFI